MWQCVSLEMSLWGWVKAGVQQDAAAALKALAHSAAKGDRLIAETKHATCRDQTLWSQSSRPRRSHWVYYTLQHSRSNTPTHKALPRGLPWCSARTIIICIQYGCDASASSVSKPVSSAYRLCMSAACRSQQIFFIINRFNNSGEFISIWVFSLKEK